MFSDNKSDVWESISDLMTGLMMIFLFIGLAFLYDLQRTSHAAADLKQAIYKELVKEFPTSELEKWGAVIDNKTMISLDNLSLNYKTMFIEKFEFLDSIYINDNLVYGEKVLIETKK